MPLHDAGDETLLELPLGVAAHLRDELALASRTVEWLTWTLVILAVTLGSVGLRRAGDAVVVGTAVFAGAIDAFHFGGELR